MDINSIVNKFVEFFKKPKEETIGKSPEGVCNLCWGIQEYDGKIREVLRDKQVDVNNKQDSYMRIQKFVKDHIDGYHLKEDEIHVCPDCPKLENNG